MKVRYYGFLNIGLKSTFQVVSILKGYAKPSLGHVKGSCQIIHFLYMFLTLIKNSATQKMATIRKSRPSGIVFRP